MATSSSSNSPCAACKFLRRKCTAECVFAPYFPPEEPQKFVNVHKIFGASNVTKLLNDLAPHQRDDAVNSLAYEAEARLKDPVYGCVGAISVLQRQIQHLQKELAAAHADLLRYTSAQGRLAPAPPPDPYLSKLQQNSALAEFPTASQVLIPLHLQQPQLSRQQVVELAIRMGGLYEAAGGLTNINHAAALQEQGVQTQIMYPPTPTPTPRPPPPPTPAPATATNRAIFGHLPTPSQYSHQNFN